MIQLYETIIVCHGLMVVGLPFSGKTCSLIVVADALIYFHRKGLSATSFDKNHTRNINPKVVTMGQPHGENERPPRNGRVAFTNWLQIPHPIASGSSLMALWMLSGLKTRILCLMTTSNSVFPVVRLSTCQKLYQ